MHNSTRGRSGLSSGGIYKPAFSRPGLTEEMEKYLPVYLLAKGRRQSSLRHSDSQSSRPPDENELFSTNGSALNIWCGGGESPFCSFFGTWVFRSIESNRPVSTADRVLQSGEEGGSSVNSPPPSVPLLYHKQLRAQRTPPWPPCPGAKEDFRPSFFRPLVQHPENQSRLPPQRLVNRSARSSPVTRENGEQLVPFPCNVAAQVCAHTHMHACRIPSLEPSASLLLSPLCGFLFCLATHPPRASPKSPPPVPWKRQHPLLSSLPELSLFLNAQNAGQSGGGEGENTPPNFKLPPKAKEKKDPDRQPLLLAFKEGKKMRKKVQLFLKTQRFPQED